MGGEIASLAELLNRIGTTDAEMVFAHDGQEIGGGFHVTEVRMAQIAAIDCGGRRSTWVEAQVQLLDGPGGARMRAQTFRRIAEVSSRALPGLGEAPLTVEFSAGNGPLLRHRIACVTALGDRMRLELQAERALCKPGGAGCCGPSAERTSRRA